MIMRPFVVLKMWRRGNEEDCGFGKIELRVDYTTGNHWRSRRGCLDF
jgi:hypothetical protein